MLNIFLPKDKTISKMIHLTRAEMAGGDHAKVLAPSLSLPDHQAPEDLRQGSEDVCNGQKDLPRLLIPEMTQCSPPISSGIRDLLNRSILES
jgi:hypothetical protein